MNNCWDNTIEAKIQVLEEKIDQIISLVGPFGVAMPDKTVLVQTLYKTKYYVPFDDDIMTPQLIVYRQWEKIVSEFLLSRVNSETIFLDIGANFGYFSCLIASHIGSGVGGQVHAFEANPKIISLLKRNIEINWGMAPVHIYEVAVSDSPGLVTLNIPQGHAANASLGKIKNGVEIDSIEINANSIDNLLSNVDRIDLAKIDVEGAEFLVLKGMKKVLAKNPNLEIVMEWSPGQMNDLGVSANEVLDFILAEGFHIHLIETNNVISREQCLGIDYGNLFLTRKA